MRFRRLAFVFFAFILATSSVFADASQENKDSDAFIFGKTNAVLKRCGGIRKTESYISEEVETRKKVFTNQDQMGTAALGSLDFQDTYEKMGAEKACALALQELGARGVLQAEDKSSSDTTPLDEALKGALAPDVLVFEDMRLKPFGPEANALASMFAEKVTEDDVRAYGLSAAAGNICDLYGFKLTEPYEQVRMLSVSSDFLNYLSDEKWAAWGQGQNGWYTIQNNFRKESAKACAFLAKNMPDMMEPAR